MLLLHNDQSPPEDLSLHLGFTAVLSLNLTTAAFCLFFHWKNTIYIHPIIFIGLLPDSKKTDLLVQFLVFFCR